jgi:hypothetical protein
MILTSSIEKEANINTSGMPPGVCVAVVMKNGQVLAREKVVVIHSWSKCI